MIKKNYYQTVIAGKVFLRQTWKRTQNINKS
jgi:hypothetical protein